MCDRKSENGIEVSTVGAEDNIKMAERLEKVVLPTMPETSDVRVTDTVTSQKAAFIAAVDDGVAHYYRATDKVLAFSRYG